MSEPIDIVIAGGGTAGWMAANLLAHSWPTDKIRITLVESPDIGIIGVGEGSTPTLKRFFQMLDIPDEQWMPRCNATYKVNIRFDGWSPQSGIQSYSHPFISQIDTFTERALFVNCRTRRLGLDTHVQPGDFLLNGVLANQGLGPKTAENFPFRIEYGYHFDSHLLGQFLRDLAVQKGVVHQSLRIDEVRTHTNGDIAALVCDNGELINGDWFFDCTGFRSLLMQQTLKVPFNFYKDNLFNDSAVVMPTSIGPEIPVETRAIAMSNGWRWQIPLTNRFGNGYVYSSDFIAPEEAEKELRQALMADDSVEARHLKMQVGSLARHWERNCIGLGLSQGFIEPLEATALHLVQIAIELFISEFEGGKFTAERRDDYNQKVGQRFERVRDYIVAHYKMNTRDDSEYWRANRDNMALSDSLKHLLHVWFQRGDLVEEIKRQELETHFGAVSWHCLLAGYGAFPPLAANQPGKGDIYQEQNVEAFLAGCALNFSSHQHNLQTLKQ